MVIDINGTISSGEGFRRKFVSNRDWDYTVPDRVSEDGEKIPYNRFARMRAHAHDAILIDHESKEIYLIGDVALVYGKRGSLETAELVGPSEERVNECANQLGLDNDWIKNQREKLI